MSRTLPTPPLFPALLAGGRGTRFWPLSRRAVPKQLLDVTGAGPMLLATQERVGDMAPRARTLAVTSEDLAPRVRSMLGVPDENVLAEPAGRGTGTAVGLACLVAHARHPDAVVLALPSDHHVAQPDRFRRLLAQAARAAAAFHGPVILGAEPEVASAHYGYLERGGATKLAGVRGLFEVSRFTEKPSEPRAMALISRGALWNCGIFCVHAASTLEIIERCVPRLGAALSRLRAHVGRRTWQAALRREYESLAVVSFDHAILERVHPVFALPADVGWSDVGTWESLASLLPGDAHGNRWRGPAFLHDSRRCVVVGEAGGSRTVVVSGASDLVIVVAGDVTFVAPREAAKDPKALLAALARERPELL